MTRVPIRVPQRHVVHFQSLAAADEKTYEAIRSALLDGPETLDASELEGRLVRSAALEPEDAEGFVDALVSLAAAVQQHGWDASHAAKTVATEVSADAGHAALTNRIEELISTPNLYLAAKAASLGSEAERTLHTFRVITDLRPVFRSDFDSSRSSPVGMVVMNTLRLDFFTSAGPEEIYISLTEEQLVDFADELKRAREKSDALRDLAEKADWPLHRRSQP